MGSEMCIRDRRYGDAHFSNILLASSRVVGVVDWAGCKRDQSVICLLYTSDAADERSSVDLGGRRIIKKKKYHEMLASARVYRQE